mmetsp:Transcript_104806/g.208269  ORF Transcript_104806/g.208269 Transcript_104806/m.208269 type:complete len:234 (-) Transcript_104806:623-1324(-)
MSPSAAPTGLSSVAGMPTTFLTLEAVSCAPSMTLLKPDAALLTPVATDSVVCVTLLMVSLIPATVRPGIPTTASADWAKPEAAFCTRDTLLLMFSENRPGTAATAAEVRCMPSTVPSTRSFNLPGRAAKPPTTFWAKLKESCVLSINLAGTPRILVAVSWAPCIAAMGASTSLDFTTPGIAAIFPTDPFTLSMAFPSCAAVDASTTAFADSATTVAVVTKGDESFTPSSFGAA